MSWPATLSNDNIIMLLICVRYCIDVVAVVVDINLIQFNSNSETDGISLHSPLKDRTDSFALGTDRTKSEHALCKHQCENDV